VRIYEVWAYFNQAKILEPYYAVLSSWKLRSDGFPEDVEGDEEKETQYCNMINEKMNFNHDGVRLTRANVIRDLGMRNHIKLMLNAALGECPLIKCIESNGCEALIFR